MRPDRPVRTPSDPGGRAPGSRATWNPLEAFAIFAVSLIVTAILAVPFVRAVQSRSAQFIAATLLGELAFGFVVLFWVRVVDRAPLAAISARPRPLGDVGYGVVGGGVLTVVAIAAGYLITVVFQALTGHQPTQPDQIPHYVHGAAFVAAGVIVVLAAPFGEELLFRGYLYNGLRRRWAILPSNLVASSLFALLHYQPGSPLSTSVVLVLAIFPVGVGLAAIYERRGSILASMAAHATFNLIGFLTIAAGRH